jgi:hypothetical protein
LKGLSPNTTAAVLRDGSAGCGRAVTAREIRDAVDKAYTTGWTPTSRPLLPPPPAWPARDERRISAILAEGRGLPDLWEESRVRLEDSLQHTEEIIPRLFRPGSLLCCGKSNRDFDTKPLEEWRGQLGQQQLIVPSPMSAVEGVTQDGRPSKHTLSNTGPRRFLICEFDTGTPDEHAGLLLHLAEFAPLVCAVHSGGKSLHGWFYVSEQPEDKARAFFNYAVKLGADKALWTRSQFVRMPDGVRDNGKQQTVYFLNFRPILCHEPL